MRNEGSATAHVGGGDNPNFARPVVTTYGPPRPKGTTIDWDALRPAEEPAPAPEPQLATSNGVTYPMMTPEDVDARFTAPSAPACDVSDEVAEQEAPEPAPPAVTTTPCGKAPQLVSPAAEPLRKPRNDTDEVDGWARLLRDTAGSPDPLVIAARINVQTALAVLEVAAHPEPAAEPAPRFETYTRPQPHRARRSHTRVDVAEIVRRYTEQRHTIAQIAADLGHGKQTVRNALRHADVQLRDDRKTGSGGNNRIDAYPADLVAQVRRLYLEEELSQGQVAARLGTSTKVVQRLMTRHDIPARPQAHLGNNGNRRRGTDNPTAQVKARLDALGVTALDVKRWALKQGLIDEIKRGVCQTSLVDAYETAHPQAAAS